MLKRGKNILNDGKCELDLDYILELQKPEQKGRTGLESVCNLLFAVREQTCLVHLRVSRAPTSAFLANTKYACRCIVTKTNFYR